MTGRSAVGRLAVDAGGSHTRALIVTRTGEAHAMELGSVNPAAMAERADQTLEDLFGSARRLLGTGPVVGWLASAAVSADPRDSASIAAEADRVRGLVGRAGLNLSLVLSNDAVPLLWGSPALDGCGVVVVCGTGAGQVGVGPAGRTARAGGCEYLASDEGGAVDLGQRGLRAAVRAIDGRGPATALTTTLARHARRPVPELARWLAAQPYPKQRLAELAPAVCRAWLSGDAVARAVVHHGVTELVLGVRAVRDRVGLDEGFAVAVTGGVSSGCPPLFTELDRRLRSEVGAGNVTLVTRPVEAVLAALTRFTDTTGRLVLPGALLRGQAALLEFV